MTVSGVETATIRFGIFEVDRRSGELRRNGVRVKLQEQPFQILLTLLERPGEVVTREELRSRLWAEDTYVDFDHSLNAAVRRLRDALADSAENPRFVETVARRGYRFLAPVNGAATAVTPQPVPATSARRFLILLTMTVLLAGVLLGWIIARARRQSGQIPSVSIKQRRLTASSEENPVLGAAISPDGKYLAFADKTGFYLRQIDSGENHSLTLPSGFAAVPAGWYPDGSHLVATWVEGPTAPPSLWQVSIMGGAPRKLIDNGQLPAVSPNGSQIAFVKGPKHAEEIWLMAGNGENPRRLVVPCQNCTVGGPAWSPDGSKIAFSSSRDGNQEIYVINADGSNPTRLTNNSDSDDFPAWSPDGSAILFSSADQAGPAIDAASINIYSIDPRTGDRRTASSRHLDDEGFHSDPPKATADDPGP